MEDRLNQLFEENSEVKTLYEQLKTKLVFVSKLKDMETKSYINYDDFNQLQQQYLNNTNEEHRNNSR